MCRQARRAWVIGVSWSVVFLSSTAADETVAPPRANLESPAERLQPAPPAERFDPAPGVESGRIFPVPQGVPSTRHYYRVATGEHRTGGTLFEDENLVYVNTPPPEQYLSLPFANIRVADDIETVAIGGCRIAGYEVGVIGGGDGTGPGFGVQLALYDDCPSSGGQIIPGTEVSLTVDHDGLHYILVDLTGTDLEVPRSFWLAVTFNVAGPGWIFGSQPTIGTTRDRFDFLFYPCSARFFGTPFYAGFHARVWCTPPFETDFVAYDNLRLTAPPAPVAPGANQWWADDVELIVDDCVLSSLELGILASSGVTFNVTAEIRGAIPPSSVVPETTQTQQVVGNGAPMIVRFDYPGGVPLPGPQHDYMVAFSFSTSQANILVPGEATLGYTDNWFCIQDGDSCVLFWFGPFGPYAGFAIRIRCMGWPGLGACCDLGAADPSEMCALTPEIACSGNLKRYVRGGKCPGMCSLDAQPCAADTDCPSVCSESHDVCTTATPCPDGETCETQHCVDEEEAFDPPCGTSACCLPPESPFGEICLNMTQDECQSYEDSEGHPAEWQIAKFCGEGAQDCIRWSCRFAEGPCDNEHPTPGCNIPSCCDKICDQDLYCCIVEWDSTCVGRATGPNGCGDLPAANDHCYDPDPGYGAVTLNRCNGDLNKARCLSSADCTPPDVCRATGGEIMRNGGATTSPEEAFCCHPSGPGQTAFGGVWYKFRATHPTARIDTCSTTTQTSTDSLIQVFIPTDESDEQAACESLVPIACSDQGDCSEPGRASVCLYDLAVGQMYYVLVASKTAATAGRYDVRLKSPPSSTYPCPSAAEVPENDSCFGASPAVLGANAYDLTDSFLDCPTESCGGGMYTNDVWFYHVAAGSGLLPIDTCDGTGNDTIISFYESQTCDVMPQWRLACNDDAGGACGPGSRVLVPVTAGHFYLIRVGSKQGDTFAGTLQIGEVIPDCNDNGQPDPCDIDCDAPGFECNPLNCGTFDDCQPNGRPDVCDILQGFAEDCNDNGVPDFCDIRDGTSGDCQPNGIPDECDGSACWIHDSVPPPCAIDARQPHPVSSAVPAQGWNAIDLIFHCMAPVLPPHQPDDYAISDPSLHISNIAVVGNIVTLTFDRVITPGIWTCITETASSCDRVCIAALPGDVDGDQVASPPDILALVDCINGMANIPCDIWQVDADREGGLQPPDILRLIDLFNGAGAFEPWLNAALPPTAECP